MTVGSLFEKVKASRNGGAFHLASPISKVFIRDNSVITDAQAVLGGVIYVDIAVTDILVDIDNGIFKGFKANLGAFMYSKGTNNPKVEL